MKVLAIIGEVLDDFKGRLDCNYCGKGIMIESTSPYLQRGWPKCCGYTMRWTTQAQEQ